MSVNERSRKWTIGEEKKLESRQPISSLFLQRSLNSVNDHTSTTMPFWKKRAIHNDDGDVNDDYDDNDDNNNDDDDDNDDGDDNDDDDNKSAASLAAH